jgi:malonyl-CoA/methylmalonyl-CoA synthetase
MDNFDFNLYSHFAQRFDAGADSELLVTGEGAAYTYRDIDSRSARIAAALTRLGVRPGDRVSVQVEKSPESLCLYLASLRAGFVFHPLNTAYKRQELEFFLADAEPAAIVCDPANEAAIRPLAARAGCRLLLTLDADGRGTLRDEADEAEADFTTVARGKDDLAALLYSSGTTGVPKGVMLSHWNLLSNTRALTDAWAFNPKDRLLHALPIFHVHGLFVAIGCVLLGGASMRWLRSFKARDAVRYLPECTVMMGVPTYYTRLLAEPSFTADVARNVRLFVSGSAPLLEETFAAFEARTGQRILERYGMTETNMNTANPLEGARKPGTVGPPLPGVEVRVVDDTGAELGTGEVGNLQVRGPNVFIGYWKQPARLKQDFTADGFFNTGDKAVIDEDGYVSIVGRAKDMVISGGLNVYPKEIELFVDALPGVRESAVIGVPHPDFGEAVVAVVVADESAGLEEHAIIEACKAGLAAFKVPKRVVFAEDLPRNAMAKVQKNGLREVYRSLFEPRLARI